MSIKAITNPTAGRVAASIVGPGALVLTAASGQPPLVVAVMTFAAVAGPVAVTVAADMVWLWAWRRLDYRLEALVAADVPVADTERLVAAVAGPLVALAGHRARQPRLGALDGQRHPSEGT